MIPNEVEELKTCVYKTSSGEIHLKRWKRTRGSRGGVRYWWCWDDSEPQRQRWKCGNSLPLDKRRLVTLALATNYTEQVAATEWFDMEHIWPRNFQDHLLFNEDESNNAIWRFVMDSDHIITRIISLEYDVKHKKIHPTQIPTRTEKEQVSRIRPWPHCSNAEFRPSAPISCSHWRRAKPSLKRDKTLGCYRCAEAGEKSKLERTLAVFLF